MAPDASWRALDDWLEAGTALTGAVGAGLLPVAAGWDSGMPTGEGAPGIPDGCQPPGGVSGGSCGQSGMGKGRGETPHEGE